jgi:hypothetical protein
VLILNIRDRFFFAMAKILASAFLLLAAVRGAEKGQRPYFFGQR